jgi:cofilin
MKKRYMIFKIEGDKEIVLESDGAREETYDQFSESLRASGEPRYGVVDVEFETADGRPNSKIVFVAFVPDTAKVKQKMIYSGSKDALKRVLLGIMVDINATDASELELETCVLPKCR